MNSPIGHERRAKYTCWLLIAAWVVVSWWLRPQSIVADWEGWRQADTQTIAVNGLRPEAKFNRPLINWSAAEPTAVEAEFQLYTGLVTPILRITGPAEWPGQAVSMLAFVIGALVLFGWLNERYGATPALAGTATLLIGRTALFLGNSIQPDGLALMFFIVAWVEFDRWMRRPDGKTWLLWTAATLLSSLAKPTNLQLGIAQFLMLALSRRELLLKPSVWAGWLIVIAGNGWQFWHGAQIHHETGLTFGVISGGDNKFAALHDLLRPGNYWALVKLSAVWGLGLIGMAAMVWAIFKRNLPLWFWCLGIAHLVELLLALNYTTSVWWGTYYHAPAAFIGATLVAHVLSPISSPGTSPLQRKALLSAFAVGMLLFFTWNVHDRLHMGRDEGANALVAFAREADRIVPKSTPVLVRTDADRYIHTWRDIVHNYQDPRLLYLLDRCGWSLWRTSVEVQDLVNLHAHPARWLLEPYIYRSTGEQEAWLEQHARLAFDRPEGRIWQFTD